ncbi:Polysaccharide biosynthesis protein [uncultured archaeon]|nr:Polysaccharide biosynthesis protein [uncultured archaeon]
MKNKLKNSYNTHKETIHNFIWRALQIFGQNGITFLIFILCAKLLTPYDFGIYNYVLAIIFFLIIFGDFGISTATSKYVAEYNITDKNKLKSVLFNSGIVILGLTMIITILTIIIGPWYLKEKYIYVLGLLPLIFMAPMTSLYDGVYRGLKKFRQLAIISLIVGFFSLSFVYILIKTYGLIGALIAQNLFYLILLIALGFGYREFNFKWNKELIKEITKYSLIIGIANFGYYLFTRINTLILGHYNLIIEIGYYELINKIFMILIIPFTILSQVIAPNITELYSKSEFKKIRSKYILYTLFSLVISTILALLIWLIFPIILKFFLSKYYNPIVIHSMNLLLIILISQCISTISAIGFSTSSGHAKLNMYWLLFFGVSNIILSILFVKNLGFIGIIYSTIIIKFLSDITFIIYYYIKIKNCIK